MLEGFYMQISTYFQKIYSCQGHDCEENDRSLEFSSWLLQEDHALMVIRIFKYSNAVFPKACPVRIFGY